MKNPCLGKGLIPHRRPLFRALISPISFLQSPLFSHLWVLKLVSLRCLPVSTVSRMVQTTTTTCLDIWSHSVTGLILFLLREMNWPSKPFSNECQGNTLSLNWVVINIHDQLCISLGPSKLTRASELCGLASASLCLSSSPTVCLLLNLQADTSYIASWPNSCLT